jgi:hypothetical protein
LSSSNAAAGQNTQSNIIIVVGIVIAILIFGVVGFFCIQRKRKIPAHEIWQTHYDKKSQPASIDMHQIYSKENTPSFVPYVQTSEKIERGERRKSRLSIHQI